MSPVPKPFKAFRIHSDSGRIQARFESLTLADLSPGEVVIRVAFSGINYKDALAATGAGNPQIARQLSVSVSTVETHLERIYAKLGIHSRRELIAITAARGGVPSGAGAGTSVRADPAGPAKD